MRATAGRLFTGRRNAGGATFLATTVFFFAAAFLAALRLVGRLPLPDPFFDLALAMPRSLQLQVQLLYQTGEKNPVLRDLPREFGGRLVMGVLRHHQELLQETGPGRDPRRRVRQAWAMSAGRPLGANSSNQLRPSIARRFTRFLPLVREPILAP